MNPILITSDTQLRSLIPNQLVTVKGEVSLFDKITSFICEAEQWLFSHFFGEDLLAKLPGDIAELASHIVALESYRRALPLIDVVLTPNGLATVGSQNLAAASKARVDRVIDSLLTYRDAVLAQLLRRLPSVEGWPDSPQGRWFGSTLFPTLYLCGHVGETERIWEKYVQLRQQIVDLEASLAEEWFSPELMAALRVENLRSSLNSQRAAVVKQIKAQIIGYLRCGSFNSRRLADIVNYIRQFPNFFPEWFGSDVADLFSPPVFRNNKNSSGYFF